MEQVAQAADGEATCFECLYDLRGQPADGRCPECGLPVAASTREDRWDRADARWRRRVRRGLVWSAAEYGVLVAAVAIGLASPDGEWVGPVLLALMGVVGVVGGGEGDSRGADGAGRAVAPPAGRPVADGGGRGR